MVPLIVSVDDGFTVSDFIRDCKKFTSTRILDAIENSGVESRRDWMLHQFKYYASLHTRNEKYQLWEQDNHPIELETPAFTQQKIDYIPAYRQAGIKTRWRPVGFTVPRIIFIPALPIMQGWIKSLMWIVCSFKV